MPAQLLNGPAGIACEFSDGRRGRWLAGDAGDPALIGDLLAGLAELVHPHGTVDAAGTVTSYMIGLRDIAAFMAARGVAGGAAALTRAALAEYWMQAGVMREATTRRMLAGFAAAGGALDPSARALAGGRRFSPRPSANPLTPYDEREWQHLQGTCRQVADGAFARHRDALAAAGRGRDPASDGLSEDNLRWLLARRGPASAAQIAARLGVPAARVTRQGDVQAAFAGLFPGAGVVIAYRALLGSYCGVVPDGIADLGVGDIDWAGDATVLLGYVKHRTAQESVTLPRRAVRLLEQWLEHSALARSHAPAELAGSLWLHCSYRSSTRWQTRTDPGAHSDWGKDHGVGLDRRRIRTTFLSARDRRSWHGAARSLIDPNHSAQVEADHYLTAVTPAQLEAVETVIEQGQADMVRRAHPPATVASGEQLAALAAGLPAALKELGVDAATAAEVVSESQDVFVAACTDPLSGLHGPAGKPCPARPWVCLLCPLAIFTPRHAGNLLRLKGFFSRQWRQMPAAQFMATFGPYSARIDEVLQHYPAAALAAAAAPAGDEDRELPLRPEEGTR